MFGEAMVACFFGSTDLAIALTFRGVELSDPGYRRVTVSAGGWAIDGAVARFHARFGPFQRGVVIDGARLMLGDKTLTPLELQDGATGEVRLLPGMTFDYTAEAGIDG